MPTVKYKSGNNWVAVTTSGSIATDSTYGYVKIATDADVVAGTDNTAAITAKQLHDQLSTDGGLVHIQGAEIITGTKTFNNGIRRSSNIDLTETTGESEVTALAVFDKTGSFPIGLYNTTRTYSTHTNRVRVINDNFNQTGNWYDLRSNLKDDGHGYVCVGKGSNVTDDSTTKITDSTTDNIIPTMGWVNNPATSTNVVHRTGDETIGGNKTFTETIQGTAYRALWGDLAEYYLTDKEYPKGTLVQFGGEKEITIAKNKVNAVITSEPGFILNSNMENSQAIALIGRVPVRVIGKVNKFDKIALSYIDGVGCVSNESENVIGIALESKDDADEGLIICSVKIDLV